ncbi:hypothetical protein Y032_0162g3399 [Ancylostoma ceylanicum]|uniref:SCP domain-containing protein n=1 Tax=Ancylostoma ceylanicum TaxID=53326 RepID=A0A016SXY5_9BILA|nr:hypothetical protein Y032_0162g3399 [Ancylostoma ceylanicum]
MCFAVLVYAAVALAYGTNTWQTDSTHDIFLQRTSIKERPVGVLSHPTIRATNMEAAYLAVILVFLTTCSNIGTATTAFNCKDSLISDEWRETVLSAHNENRRELAKGSQMGKAAALPKATKMKELYWDCAVEEKARTQADTCGTPTPPQNYGAVQLKMRIKGQCDEDSS